LCQLDGLLTREIGTFLLLGKSKPVRVHELLCSKDGAEERLVQLCATFAEAIDAFRRELWKAAAERFRECITISGGDRPSEYYIRLCEEYQRNPLAEAWDGIIRMVEK
jgi:adenylate cyclase